MWRRLKSLFVLLLVSSCLVPDALGEEEDGGYGLLDVIPYVAVGAGAAVFGVPAALSYAGFTTAGIASGSVASWMMSISALASGGGVPAGGVVATLQSLGAAASTKGLATAGAAAGYSFWNLFCGNEKSEKE